MKRRRNNWNLKELLDSGSEAFRALNGDKVAGSQSSKQERNRLPALGHEKPHQTRMVKIDGRLFVRITRIIPGGPRQDDDNAIGGAKQLRDAIAAALGRKGDSQEDGLRFEVCEQKGPFEVRIEVFDDKE